MKVENFRFLSIVTLCLVMFLSACSKDDQDDATAEEKKKDERVPVEVAQIARGKIEAVIQATTHLEAEAQVQVFARTSNQVVELLVEEGDRVKKGQLLIRLEDDTHKIQLAKAEVRLSRATKEYERKKELGAKELITVQEFNEATYELKQAELEQDEARQQLSYTRVGAPIAGTITARMIKLGDHVNTNQHLFDIIDFGSIVARVYLPEKNLAHLALGQKARIVAQAMGKDVFVGDVDKIAPVVDAKTGTVKVTVAVPENGVLRPGMYVNVALILKTHTDALLIPKRALVYDGDQLFVFKVNEKREVERLLLTPALMDRDFVEPAAGFDEGDRIVVAGHTGLKNGALVRVLGEADPAQDEGQAAQEGAAKEMEATTDATVAAEGSNP